jgi:hypothetical protein
MNASWTRYAWHHRPTVPPEGGTDLEVLRPMQVVRVRDEGERSSVAEEVPEHLRIRFVQEPAPAVPLDLPPRMTTP